MESDHPSVVIRRVEGLVVTSKEALRSELVKRDVVVLEKRGDRAGKYMSKITIGNFEVALPTADDIVHAQK